MTGFDILAPDPSDCRAVLCMTGTSLCCDVRVGYRSGDGPGVVSLSFCSSDCRFSSSIFCAAPPMTRPRANVEVMATSARVTVVVKVLFPPIPRRRQRAKTSRAEMAARRFGIVNARAGCPCHFLLLTEPAAHSVEEASGFGGGCDALFEAQRELCDAEAGGTPRGGQGEGDALDDGASDVFVGDHVSGVEHVNAQE